MKPVTEAAARSARQLRTQEMLLSALREHGPATRAELSDFTGLSRSAIGAAAQVLLASQRVTEQALPLAGSQRGRPSTQLTLANPPGLVIGIDFGHAHVTAALARATGEILDERRVDGEVDTQPERAFDTAAAIVTDLLLASGSEMGEIRAIAAGIPGPIDTDTAVMGSATILADWVGLDPSRELRDRFGIPVTIGNDANMGAQGELRFGVARSYRDFLYVKASRGIGAGLVLNGQVYRGSSGVAGEIGHTHVPGATSLCRCGSRGCLETIASITEVQRQLAHVLPPGTPLEPLDALSSNTAAARVITEAGRTIGRALADLCNCLNPAAIVLGGELGTAGRPLAAGVRESIDRYAQPAAAAAVTIHAAQLGVRAELMGAIATAIEVFESERSRPPRQ